MDNRGRVQIVHSQPEAKRLREVQADLGCGDSDAYKLAMDILWGLLQARKAASAPQKGQKV